jgi:hypothetical protein
MNEQRGWFWMFVRLALVLLGALLIASCVTQFRVDALRSESQSVELDDAGPVRVDIDFGAGDLEITGGAENLLEADFTYNVDKLKPEVKYTNGSLHIRQPGTNGLPSLINLTDYRNEWDLRLSDQVPLELSVNMGAGSGDLKLGGLSLTELDINLGASISTIDLSGDWARDLNVTIEAGAANVSVRLPAEVGVRVEVESGPHTVMTRGLAEDGDIYTNQAYGESEVTLWINVEAGIGNIILEVEEKAAARQD